MAVRDDGRARLKLLLLVLSLALALPGLSLWKEQADQAKWAKLMREAGITPE